jgi:hypothetical protein
MSDTKPVVAFVARPSDNEWDEIIPYDRNEAGYINVKYLRAPNFPWQLDLRKGLVARCSWSKQQLPVKSRRLMRALNDSSCPLLPHRQGVARRQAGPTHVPKEFTAFSPAFGFCLQQHEIGHFANARCSLMNSREVLLAHELYERFGVLFLRQPDLINNHVVTPFR